MSGHIWYIRRISLSLSTPFPCRLLCLLDTDLPPQDRPRALCSLILFQLLLIGLNVPLRICESPTSCVDNLASSRGLKTGEGGEREGSGWGGRGGQAQEAPASICHEDTELYPGLGWEAMPITQISWQNDPNLALMPSTRSVLPTEVLRHIRQRWVTEGLLQCWGPAWRSVEKLGFSWES